MPPSTACTCASSFTLTSTWASSWPTLACPTSSLPGPKTNKDSSAALLVLRSAGLSPRFGGHAFSVPASFSCLGGPLSSSQTKRNNRQPPSRLQRPHQAGIKLRRLRQVMVNVPQENRVATSRRQIRIRLFALQHHHIPELPFRHLGLQFLQLLRINLRRIHSARRPHPFHRRKRVLPVPRPNIRRHRPPPPPPQPPPPPHPPPPPPPPP